MLEKLLPNLSNKWKGALSVIACLLLHLILALYYLWSTINIYVISYYKLEANPDLHNSFGVIFLPIFTIAQNLTGLVSVQLLEVLGVSASFALWSSLLAASTFLSSYMSNMYLFLIFFGLLQGCCAGLIWIIPVHSCFPYFSKNRGLVNGILQSAFGIGGVIYNSIALEYMNPENFSPLSIPNSPEKFFGPVVAERVPGLMRVLGIYQIALGIAGAFTVFSPPEKKGEAKNNIDPTKTEVEIGEALIRKEPEIDESSGSKSHRLGSREYEPGRFVEWEVYYEHPITVKDALQSHAFIYTFLMCFFSTGVCYMVSINVKNYGITRIPDDQFVTSVASVATFVNGATRTIWGILYDKYGFKKIFGVMLILQLVILVLYCPLAHNKFFFAVSNIIMITILGIHFVIFSPLWSHIFDPKISTRMVVYACCSFALATLCQFLILNFLNEAIGYQNIIWIEFIFILICVYLLSKFRMPELLI